MNLHDWTIVDAGTWNCFQLSWNVEISKELNTTLLPADYYSQVELTNCHSSKYFREERSGPCGEVEPAIVYPLNSSLILKKPRARFEAEAEMDEYVSKQRTITIRHSSDDQIIALIELISPGNKSSKHGIKSIVEKSVEALYRGYHLLIIDLFPPTPRDPDGLPALIWSDFAEKPYELPKDEPLTLSAYEASRPKRLYVETTAVGKMLPDMPLFLEPGSHILVPLDATYTAAFRGVPRKWQSVLNA